MTIAARVTRFNIGNSQDLTNRFIDGELEHLHNATIKKTLQCRKVLRRDTNDGGSVCPNRRPRRQMALT
jgi:hypothetical protein